MTSQPEQDKGLPDWAREVLLKHDQPGTDQLSVGIVTYGSLLHPDEVKRLFGFSEDNQVKVKVKGYQRRFNKRIAKHIYRETEPEKTAVLNLERNEGAWFNGLLLGPIDRSDLKQYAFREQEYELEAIEPSSLEFYNCSRHIPEGIDGIYTCLLDEEGSLNSTIEPVPSYLDLCLKGASRHGEYFAEDFEKTTRVLDKTLKQYLSDHN